MKFRILALILVLIAFQTSFSQDIRSYKGGYTFKGIRGTAELSYSLDAALEPILNGPFSFDYRKMDSLRTGFFRKLDVKGSYLEDKKEGAWFYQDETHDIDIKNIQGQEIKATISSHLIELQANYQKGKLNGLWDYLEKQSDEKETLDLFEAKGLRFDSDSLLGSVKFVSRLPNQPYQIYGQVGKGGLMVGTWEFFYPLDSSVMIHESRRYEKGFLIGLSKVNNLTNHKFEEVVFFNAIQKLDSLNRGFDVDYRVSDQAFGLIFNDGYTQNSEEFQEQYKATFLIEDALSRVLQFEDDFFSEKGILQAYPLTTRRFVYQVSKEDQSRYDQIIEYYDRLQIQSKQKGVLDFLSLNNNTSDSLAFSASYLDYLSKKMDDYQPVMELIRTGEIQYFDTENYLRDGLKFLDAEEEIVYTYKADLLQKTLDFSEITKQKNLAIDLLAYIEKEWMIFQAIHNFIQVQQVNFRQTNELQVLEERILQEKEGVKRIKNKISPSGDRHQKLIDSVYHHLTIDNYQALLNQYNEEEDFLEKAEIGDEMIELFLFLEGNLSELGRYEKLGNSLRQDFTEMTLDPFTFETDFEVLRQPGLIMAAEAIIDHELRLIQGTVDFRKIQQHLLNLDALEIRIQELKGKNTKRLEKNIRKVSGNISQLKKLLSI